MKIIILLIALLGVIDSKIYFKESFNEDNWESNWVQSKHKSEYGKFVRSHGKFFGDENINMGIQTSQDAKFYSLSTQVEKFSNSDKKLVVQFSVKHEQNIDCGGGYIKLFPCDMNQEDLHGETPYFIMFGPDICGPGTKKVHAIINYKEKNHLIKKDVRCKDDVYTHVYTFVLSPDNTFEIYIDNEKVESGDIEDSWDILPPKTIKDPEAKKPEDWDDRKFIDDESDTKPEDWEKPEHIPDPDATKPEDWDDEMDGEWEPPMIDNPEYKGEWKPKQIENPAYKGEWVHPEIKNPDYVPDDKLHSFDNICYVGFDLWQVKSGTIFDDIIVTDDLEEAKKFAEDTWAKTKDDEKKMKESQDEEEMKKDQEQGDADKDEDDEDLDDLEDEEESAQDKEEEEKEDSPHEEL